VVDPGLILADDEAFDERLPIHLQLQASTHFTPVDVARYAARLLAPLPGTRVLDVGSGAGKFCLAAACAAPESEFVGVEWRPHLVDLANALARELGVGNVRFVHGDALELDWSLFDSFYLFNPFAEQLFEYSFVLDHSIEFSPDTFVDCVSGVRRKLSRARLGTRVVTYHGYGAPPPLGYELSRQDPIGSKQLQLWVKSRIVTREIAAEDDPR
jgi:SAM-dependent methyltransferase